MTLFGTKPASDRPRCALCRRPLRSAASIALGMGTYCARIKAANKGGREQTVEEMQAAEAQEEPQAIAA